MHCKSAAALECVGLFHPCREFYGADMPYVFDAVVSADYTCGVAVRLSSDEICGVILILNTNKIQEKICAEIQYMQDCRLDFFQILNGV